jgi:hypothetical protein
MIKDEMCKEEAQSLRELVEEEVAIAILCKTKKKKMKGKGEAGLSKVLAQERTLSFMVSLPKVREESKQMYVHW